MILYTHIYLYIYLYTVCVCVCVHTLVVCGDFGGCLAEISDLLCRVIWK